ncbi:MAG: uL14 family ribosomal protein [Candidatus Pacearchaeota archaeon]
MKAVAARTTEALNLGAKVVVADNSGAKLAKVVAVKGAKAKKGKQVAAKIADKVKVSVKKGVPDMKGKVFDAIVVRQKKPFRRLNGERVAFEDNALSIVKDDKGNPKGTQIKGPIAREVQQRWPQVAKIARTVY